MILTIISHTPHYRKSKKIYGFGPTIDEINFLKRNFTRIYHLAPFYSEYCPKNTNMYLSNNIIYVPLKLSGGPGLINKLKILLSFPQNMMTVQKYCSMANLVHFRSPTNLGLFVLPYISFFLNKPRWIKYAGNWNQDKPPFSYNFQRLWLKYNFHNSPVTINGKWPNQKPHLFSFENPCILEDQLKTSVQKAKSKDYSKRLNICFVGRLEEEKGILIILSALKKFKSHDWIDKIFIVGDGTLNTDVQFIAEKIKSINFQIMGNISRTKLDQIYKICHILILPSKSEGFPKVVAEASAFGCVSIVSNVGSISNYVNNTNGYLLEQITDESLYNKLKKIKNKRELLQIKAANSLDIPLKFTFESYNSKIKKILELK